jgi:hypothetical protein
MVRTVMSIAMLNLAVCRLENRTPLRSPWLRDTKEPDLEVPPMLTFEERMARFEIDMAAFEQRLAA